MIGSRRRLGALGVVIATVAAVALLLVPALASTNTSNGASQATTARYGPGVAINVAAVTMVARPTIGCPAPPNAQCESRPGVDGVGPSTPPTSGFLVGAEGILYAPIQIPPGSRIIRLELIGHDNDHGLAGPGANLWATGPRGSRILAATALEGARPGLRRATDTAITPAGQRTRADTAYYVTLHVRRPYSAETPFAIQMVRVVYRPLLAGGQQP